MLRPPPRISQTTIAMSVFSSFGAPITSASVGKPLIVA